MTDQEKITHLASLLGWTRNFAFQCWRYANGELAAFSTWNPLTSLADCEPLMDFVEAKNLRWEIYPTDSGHWCYITGDEKPYLSAGYAPTRAAAFCEAVLDAFPMKEGE